MKKIGLIIGGLTLMAFLFVGIGTVSANPSFFQRFQNILSRVAPYGVATTTPVYLIPGIATSTIYADIGAGNYGAGSAVLAVQQIASSTGVVNWRLEYAHDTTGFDCVKTPTACDWYLDNMFNTGVVVSTTTSSGISYLPNTQTYSWTYASSTDGCATGLALVSINRACRMIEVPVPTRYVRAVFYLPIGTTRAAVWAEFISKKQVN